MMSVNAPVSTLQAASTLLVTVASHKLDYDARVLPPGAFAPLAERLDAVATEAFAQVMGHEAAELSPHVTH